MSPTESESSLVINYMHEMLPSYRLLLKHLYEAERGSQYCSCSSSFVYVRIRFIADIFVSEFHILAMSSATLLASVDAPNKPSPVKPTLYNPYSPFQLLGLKYARSFGQSSAWLGRLTLLQTKYQD